MALMVRGRQRTPDHVQWARGENREQVDVPGSLRFTPEQVLRARDMSVCRMADARVPYAAVARFHGITERHVRRILATVPAEFRSSAVSVSDLLTA